MITQESSSDIISNDFMGLMKNGKVKPGTWKNIENHKIYAKWLGETLGYKNMDDWYQITKTLICDNYGGGLLVSKYKNSTKLFVMSVFPDVEWLPWKFDKTLRGYWNDIENHKIYANWLGETLGYKNMNDWYKITQRLINDNHGCGLLDKKYNSSPLMFLKGVFPDVEWLPWKFGSASNGYWDNIENHKIYAKWLGERFGYKNTDDWYKITKTLIHDNHGGGLLVNKYRDSPLRFLEGVFPDVEWLPWKFYMSSHGTWDDIENHIKYAKWLGETLGYKNTDDWYQITQRLIVNNDGSGLLQSKYKGSPKLFVMSVYPEYNWDSCKFVKNYSQGQIEWLNYMILSIPDIIHAINNSNGEYSIPNSRYHADGYSESKKMILEYHGDFYHGNPKLFNEEEMNLVTKTTFGELYQNTLEKKRFCQEHEYEYFSIWESEWIRGKISIIKLQQKFKEKYCKKM